MPHQVTPKTNYDAIRELSIGQLANILALASISGRPVQNRLHQQKTFKLIGN